MEGRLSFKLVKYFSQRHISICTHCLSRKLRDFKMQIFKGGFPRHINVQPISS